MPSAIKNLKITDWIMIGGCLVSVGIFYNRTDSLESCVKKLEDKIETINTQMDVKDEKDRQYAYNQTYSLRQKFERSQEEAKQFREEFIEMKVEFREFNKNQEKLYALLSKINDKMEK